MTSSRPGRWTSSQEWCRWGVGQRDERTSVPWIRSELELLSQALERGVPILGVCFGSQSLARAAGVRSVNRPTEIGWHDVTMTSHAETDPVLGSLGKVPAFQWHYDTFDLPPDATVLATAGDLIEAYRVGDSAWGSSSTSKRIRRLSMDGSVRTVTP